MHPTRIVHPVLRRLLVVLLLLTGACTSWHVETLPPAQLVADRKPEQVRIRLMDHERFVLRTPTIRGDSLVGRQDGDTRSVSLFEIQEIAVRRGDGLRTLGLGFLIVAATVGALFVAYVISCGDGCTS